LKNETKNSSRTEISPLNDLKGESKNMNNDDKVEENNIKISKIESTIDSLTQTNSKFKPRLEPKIALTSSLTSK